MKEFLNRPIYDPNTMTYRFKDGSGVVPEEMHQDMLLAQQKRTRAGGNGVYVLDTLWKWKDRLGNSL